MPKKKEDATDAQENHEQQLQGDQDRGELIKVATGVDKAIFNGHVLPEGTVIELYQDEIEAHRNGGVALLDVEDDDEREVFDHSVPYEANDGE